MQRFMTCLGLLTIGHALGMLALSLSSCEAAPKAAAKSEDTWRVFCEAKDGSSDSYVARERPTAFGSIGIKFVEDSTGEHIYYIHTPCTFKR